MKNSLLATSFLLVTAGTVHAGGSGGSIGVGAEYMAFGIGLDVGGASVVFDQGDFHAGAFLGFSDGVTPGDDTEITLGGQFYYHVHSTAMSDFGVGAMIALQNEDDPDPDNERTDVFIDLGAQIRAFVTSNVALSFGIGLGIATADADGVVLSADPVAVGGVHYYFF